MAQGVRVFLGEDIVVKGRGRAGFWEWIKSTCVGLCLDEVTRAWFDPTELTINGEEWSLGKFLNHGAEGQAYLMTRKSDGKKFAAKFVSIQNSKEVELARDLPPELVAHENFVRYEMVVLGVRAHFPPANDILVMENVPNGELWDMIYRSTGEWVNQRVSLSIGTCRRFARDIISGMAQCYRVRVTHRDLKPENLLIDQKGRVVIIDLGHAKHDKFDDESSASGPRPPIETVHPYGTREYAAPEVTRVASAGPGRPDKYDCEKADVWSVGVIVFAFHAVHPFPREDVAGPNNEELWSKLEQKPHVKRFPGDLKRFLNTLLRQDPRERPSFAQLELAMDKEGNGEVLRMFPGLQWLAEPLNDYKEFIAELRNRRPHLEFGSFQSPAPGARGAAPKPGQGARRSRSTT